jgi:Tol biopolymer transport system component
LIVPPGGSGMLAVAASGSGPLSYEWLKDGVPISGETSAVLIFDNVDESAEGRYAVRVSNALGSLVSAEVELILLGAPKITTHPSALSTPENNSVTFAVGASGSGIHYQWLRNGFEIAGATQHTYTTPMLTVADSGAVYTVIVFNSAGITISQPAVLTVYAPVPPTVLQQPADVSVQAGAPANLCMAFGGTPPFNVQMNRSIAGVWTPIGAAISFNDNSPTCISTPNLQLADNGAQFVFFASNAEGGIFEAMTRTVTVTVTAPPTVTVTTLASRATSGATANNRSGGPTLSADGNLVAFYSNGTNLVPGFGDGSHGYVRNLLTGVTTAVDQMPNGAQPALSISQMKLAAGGRYVVFSSLAPGIVAEDTNDSLDVFLRDLQTGTTERLSVLSDGSQLTGAGNGNGDMRLDISADGRYVIFASQYDFSNMGELLPQVSLFLRDTQSDQTRIVVANPSYMIGYAALSSGGRYIAYALSIGNPAPAPVQVYDIQASSTAALFTVDQSTNADYLGQGLSISGDGRYVAFALRSQPLLGSTVPQVVVIDRNDPATLMVASTGSAGSGIGLGNGISNYPKLSDDGRYVAFSSMAANISGNVGNSLDWAVVLRDLQTQTTTVASRRADGVPVRTAGNADDWRAISGDGSVVGFVANQTDMGDGNVEYQVYVAPRP